MYSKHKKSPHQELHIDLHIITYYHIFTQMFFSVHLYCTILYCHPLYLCCEVQLSCMFVSFTCPSPCLYRSLVQVLVCIVHLSKSLFVSFTCPCPCLYRSLVQVLVCIVHLSKSFVYSLLVQYCVLVIPFH